MTCVLPWEFDCFRKMLKRQHYFPAVSSLSVKPEKINVYIRGTKPSAKQDILWFLDFRIASPAN